MRTTAVLLSLLLSACGGGQGSSAVSAKDWTVMVYMSADNDLEAYAYDDIAEMEVTGSTPSMNVVVLLDTATRDGGAARRLYVRAGAFDLLSSAPEIDMADWHTLGNFGAWVVDNFPARHVALVGWGHGSGWRGLGQDDHPSGELSIPNGNYARALAAITNELGDKLDLVGFSMGLMGVWEVAEATAPYAHVLVASEEILPVQGWPYESVLSWLIANSAADRNQLGTEIVDAYSAASSADSTLAAIDLDTIPALRTAVSAFADGLRAHPELAAALDDSRNATQSFSLDDTRDLWDFASRVQAMGAAPADVKSAAAGVIAQLGTTIIHSEMQSGYENAHGMAIYLPARGGGMEPDYASGAWSNNATWDEFLAGFTQ